MRPQDSSNYKIYGNLKIEHKKVKKRTMDAKNMLFLHNQPPDSRKF